MSGRSRGLLLEAPAIHKGGATVTVVSAPRAAPEAFDPEVRADDADLFRPRLIEFGETRAETIVSARPFVREELVVGRSTGRRVERIDETVRRTEVEVEKLPAREQGTRRPR